MLVEIWNRIIKYNFLYNQKNENDWKSEIFMMSCLLRVDLEKILHAYNKPNTKILLYHEFVEFDLEKIVHM